MVARDLNQSTFTFESTYHSSVAFAQNWLVERGCPPERTQVGGDFMKPADEVTTRVEERLRTSGARYEVLDSSTSEFDPCETWTVTRDSTAAEAPIRVFLEEGEDFHSHTHTMREGAFADEDAARQWLDDRNGPLPQPPKHRGDAAAFRARAALTRPADASAVPKAGVEARSMPSAGTARRPGPGRSM